jgi:plasmid rolling circle replication initiator protein Rep
MPPNATKVSARIRDELRSVAAVYIYAAIHNKGSMQQKDQERLMENMFHGSKTHASHKKMLSEGDGT